MMNQTDLRQDVLKQFADYDQHERIRRVEDSETGLIAFIGVHNRNLGPALGGCRMYPYASEEDAVRDVLRLSRGMTYKNALAGLPLGGGKSVIIGDPFKMKNENLMRAMGRAIESLQGEYISAEDSGTNEHDMLAMSKETAYVVGLPQEKGAQGGDPSPVTALGVFSGIKAALRRRYGSETMAGLKVSVQGLGAVGFDVCRRLYAETVELTVTDVRAAILEEATRTMPGIRLVGPDEIFGVEANVFSPCALGAQLNVKTIPQLRTDIVAGAANNQLATPEDEDRLAEKKILYVPDYAINAGGVISAGYEYFRTSGRNAYGFDLTREGMMAHVSRIGHTIDKIFALADSEGITTGRAADRLARSLFMDDAAVKHG